MLPARAAGRWCDAPTEQDVTNYWTWHKKLLDMTRHRVEKPTNLQMVLWGIHRWVRRSFLRNSWILQKADGEHCGCCGEWDSARPTVLGNYISLPPHKAEITLIWYQKYQNSYSTSTGVDGAEIDWMHRELLNPWTFKRLASHQFNFFTLFSMKVPGNKKTLAENKDPSSAQPSAQSHAWTERVPGKQGTALLSQQSCTQLPQELIWQLHCKGLTQKVWSILQPKCYQILCLFINPFTALLHF